jgi:hypothetical protein
MSLCASQKEKFRQRPSGNTIPLEPKRIIAACWKLFSVCFLLPHGRCFETPDSQMSEEVLVHGLETPLKLKAVRFAVLHSNDHGSKYLAHFNNTILLFLNLF